MKRVLGAVLFAAVLGPQSASAQVTSQIRQWTMSCGPGAMGCISWNVRLEYDPYAMPNPIDDFTGGATRFVATVSNRQGLGAFADTGPALGITQMYLDGLGWEPLRYQGVALDPSAVYTNGLRSSSQENAGVSFRETPLQITPLGAGTRGPSWEAPFNGATVSMFGVVWGVGDIFGCQPPENLAPPEYARWYATCGGSLTFERTLPGRVWFTDASTARTSARNSSFQSVSETTILVPEPSTYLLMLTGLFGLGFVAWRRKEEGATA